VALAILLGVAGFAGYWYLKRAEAPAVVYRTAAVKRGEIVVNIGATGTVEPEEVVDIGAQVAGVVESFGKDKNGQTIDYGSVVEEGTVLAKIDDSLYQSNVAQAQATLAQANAGLVRAKADIEQMNAKLYQAQRDWDRAQKLGPSEALAQTSYDGYQAAFDVAKSNVAVDEAAIEQGKAAVMQADATLKYALRNLDYCTIKSPVKGVIIDRRVNIGQTVVSSLSAPSLFLLAKDLTRMQVWVSVNEADIGNIRPGQPVSFTVDAYPGRVFHGTVGKVRLNATMVQNVVTYTVEVITDNSDGKLLPYLTANAQFELKRQSDILEVPNAALRWSPAGGQATTASSAPASGGATRNGGTQGAQGASGRTENGNGEESAKRGTLWVTDGTLVNPIQVTVGVTDGTMTEVAGEGVVEGLQVIVGEDHRTAGETGTSNPFVPQLRPARPASTR
jgi:HlyD family secretion protein